MFYQSVVLEERDVIYRGLDAQNQAEFVIHFYGNRTHGVLDPGSLDPCVEIVAHFTFIVLMELSSEEGCDVFRFYGVDGSPAKIPID